MIHLTPDQINAIFELVGAWFTWKNAYALWKDRMVRGVYLPSTFFFTSWGLWNTYLYPHLALWYSFYAGIILVLGNVVWCVMALMWRNRNK